VFLPMASISMRSSGMNPPAKERGEGDLSLASSFPGSRKD
jgi:hypothetical protein